MKHTSAQEVVASEPSEMSGAAALTGHHGLAWRKADANLEQLTQLPHLQVASTPDPPRAQHLPRPLANRCLPQLPSCATIRTHNALLTMHVSVTFPKLTNPQSNLLMWELDEEAGCTEVGFPVQGPRAGDGQRCLSDAQACALPAKSLSPQTLLYFCDEAKQNKTKQNTPSTVVTPCFISFQLGSTLQNPLQTSLCL